MKQLHAFYEVYIPVSIVLHPTFIEVVKATNKARALYKLPTYHVIRKNFIVDALSNTLKLVELKTKSFIYKYGCIICSDGWENFAHWPLVYIIQICLAIEVFFCSIGIIGNTRMPTMLPPRPNDILPEWMQAL